MRERARRQQASLLSLVRESPGELELPDALHAIARASAETLGVGRVGIWLFSEDRQLLRCLYLYGAQAADREADPGGGQALRAQDYPAYFAAMYTDRTIAAGDALADPRTREFSEDYLRPHGIRSMLDAPIWYEGRTVGVVCHEHVGEPRPWHEDEQLFASSIADLVALALERSRLIETQRALRDSRTRLASLLKNLPHVVLYELGEASEIVSENAGSLLGVTPEALRREPGGLRGRVHPDDRADLARELEEWNRRGARGVLVAEYRLRRADGEYLWVEDHLVQERRESGGPVQVGVVIDVTDRRRAEDEKRDLEEQLRQAQKMEAIGRLAGGVAHDFNNLLTGILGYASLLHTRAGNEAAVRRAAAVIEGAARRAAELTGKLLGFARKGKHRDIPVDLHASVNEVIDLLQRAIDKSIAITTRLAAPVATVRGDPAQLQQVLLNLALNARDAMPGGGTLGFATRERVLAGGGDRRPGRLPPGAYLELRVSDTGEGIGPELRAQVFEPFFTTKESGKGLGLGLAMVYGIVQNHGGSVRVCDCPGPGATFELLLPLCPGERPAGEPAPRDPAPRGRARILIVDDEAVVRQVATELLEDLGYEVVAVADGEAAVAHYRNHGDQIDLVILDMVMPGLDGRATFRELQKLDPGVRAILSTGYSLDGSTQEILAEGMVGFAPKPYQLDSFGDQVAAALRCPFPRKDRG